MVLIVMQKRVLFKVEIFIMALDEEYYTLPFKCMGKMFLSFDPPPAMYELQKARARTKPMCLKHLDPESSFRGLRDHQPIHEFSLDHQCDTKPVFDAPTKVGD